MSEQISNTSLSADQISYASSGKTKGSRAFIRGLENMTGRRAILKRARRYHRHDTVEVDFWAQMIDLFNLRLDVISGSLENIPKEGPLILVSNHPFGILDGLFMGHILSQRRDDFRIVAHRIFGISPRIRDIILPISFDETAEGVQTNLKTRQKAIKYLRDGGAVGIFPGGTVSTAQKPFGRPADPAWRTFSARMITKSGATVVPIYFDGQNSRLWQVASHAHYTLRLGLMINEFKRRIGRSVPICVGDPIKPETFGELTADRRDLMDHLREMTYQLAPNPAPAHHYGFEFENHHKSRLERSSVPLTETPNITPVPPNVASNPPN